MCPSLRLAELGFRLDTGVATVEQYCKFCMPISLRNGSLGVAYTLNLQRFKILLTYSSFRNFINIYRYDKGI